MSLMTDPSGLFPAASGWLNGIAPLAGATLTAPPRWNFAGFCEFCGVRGCLSTECVRRYLATWWGVCARCEGDGVSRSGLTCEACLWGVVEVHPGTPGAVHP